MVILACPDLGRMLGKEQKRKVEKAKAMRCPSVNSNIFWPITSVVLHF